MRLGDVIGQTGPSAGVVPGVDRLPGSRCGGAVRPNGSREGRNATFCPVDLMLWVSTATAGARSWLQRDSFGPRDAG